MNDITVSAKTVDDAITEASIQLGVSSDQMEYDVIEKGSPGILGIGRKQAVIRAWRKKNEEEISFDDIKLSDINIKPNKPEKYNKSDKQNKPNKAEKPEKSDKDRSDKPDKKENNEPKRENKKNKNRKKDKKPNKDASLKQNNQSKPVSNPAPQKKEEEKEKEPRKEIEIAVVTEETMKICEKFLQDVLKAMGMDDVELKSRIDEDGSLSVEMSGENMGILIGKRGQTLDSLQYLTNRVANKSQDGYVRVKLDTEDYRKRRQKTLESLAKNIAYKVKRSRKPISLEPMNPYERRIIHSALQSDEKVSTHSEGEEPYRRVVVTLNRK